MLSIIILTVVKLSVVMLNVVKLSVVMLNVAAPIKVLNDRASTLTYKIRLA
jgi:hypothetical protein